MKNVQIIDGADNCVYDIFSFTEEQFNIIFPNQTDIAFIDEVETRVSPEELEKAFNGVWKRRVRKCIAQGIHGTLFYELEKKKIYYPNRKEDDAINPDDLI